MARKKKNIIEETKNTEEIKKESAIKFDTEEKKEVKKKGINPKELIGLTIKVNYHKTLCYLDRRNHIYIGLNVGNAEAKEKGYKSEYTIDGELQDTEILEKYLKAGLIFLYKNDLDVTKNFGGTATLEDLNSNRKPVYDVINEFKVDKEKDAPYLELLANNDKNKIIMSINSVDLVSAKRLLELEKMGYNNFKSARNRVVRALEDRIKTLSEK